MHGWFGSPLAPQSQRLLKYFSRCRVEWLAIRRCSENPCKAIVEPADERRYAPKVSRQFRLQVILSCRYTANPLVHRNVRAAKSVNRLLRITYQSEFSSRQDHILPTLSTRLSLA